MWRATTDAGTHHLFSDDEVTAANGDEDATSLCGSIETDGPFVATEVDTAGPEDDWCENCLKAVEEDTA